MLSLSEAIKEEFQFSLQKAEYNRIDAPAEGVSTDIELKVKDSLIVTEISNETLCFQVVRSLFFQPANLYSITVVIDAVLSFKDGFVRAPEQDKAFWCDLLKTQGANITGNLLSRTSMIISNILAAMGHIPVITPPSLIDE